MKDKTFVSIDFEHVTELQAICQVGFVLVENGEIVTEERYYINPMVGDFSGDYAVKNVHHITPDDVRDSETFRDFWDNFKKKYAAYTWVFHNADSDMKTLKKNLCHAGICEEIKLIPEVVDTMKLFGGYSLDSVCEAYGIPFENDHDALHDAVACARAYLYYLNGVPHEEFVSHSEQAKIAFFKEKRIDSDVLKKDLTNADPSHPFYDKKVVITGTLEAYPKRNELAMMLKKVGSDVDTNISRKTDYVIVGEGAGPSKMKKIAELQEQGYPITILNEEELKEILKSE